MLQIERPMSSHDSVVQDYATSPDAVLSKIYNNSGKKEGMRLSLGLAFKDAHNASLTSVTTLEEPAREAREMSWSEWWKNDFIRAVSLSPHYRIMADRNLRQQ